MTTSTDLQPLPLPCSDFSFLRSTGKIYVDKTAQIYSLCRFAGSQIFLARPRRFGKSLLVSTFESLFANGLRDFEGLAIEKLWNDSGTYDVVRLDFSELAGAFKTIEEFRDLMATRIFNNFPQEGGASDDARLPPAARFSQWLRKRPVNSLVLLIDEYDAPLTALLHQPALFAEVQAELGNFYLTIKAWSRCLRFFFMTGITKLAGSGIFTGFNTVQDISLCSDCASLAGFTEDEIKENFGPHLERAAETLGLTQHAVVYALRTNYGGFCFDRKASTHVFCPWSVLNFLNRPAQGFQHYWFASGGHSSLLVELLRGHPLENPAAFDRPLLLESHVLEAPQSGSFSLPALLTQAGCLTIKDVPLEGCVRLGYPNQEVRNSFARLYAGELLHGADLNAIEIIRLKRALEEGDIDETVRILNLVFAAIDAVRYPVTDEATCRNFLRVLLIGAAMLPQVAVHTANEESMLELEVGLTHWILEIEFARREGEAETLLAEGIRQMRSRDYGRTPHGLTLVRAVLVFDGAARAFTRASIVDDVSDSSDNHAAASD